MSHPIDVLAKSTVAIALDVERAVLEDGKRADRTLAGALRMRQGPGRARSPVHQPVRLRPLPLEGMDRAPGLREAGGAVAPGLAARLRDRPSGLPVLGPRARPRPGPADGPGRCAELDGAGRRAEEVARGASRDGRPLAALPPLAPRASPPAAGGRVAQDEICRAAADLADARPALGPRPECRRVQALGRALALGGEALDPSPGDPRGQARARFRRAPPPRLRARRAGNPGPRLAGGGTRLRPRPGRPLVGRLRGGRRQGPPSGRADGGQGGRRRHRHPSLEAQGGRPTRQAEPVPEPDDQGMGRPARRRQAAQLRRRAGRRPLLGHRHLATQSRLPLVDRPPGDPQAGRAPAADPQRRGPGRPARRRPGLLRLHLDPGRDPGGRPGLPRRPSRVPPRPLPAPPDRSLDRRHPADLAPGRRHRLHVHRADDPHRRTEGKTSRPPGSRRRESLPRGPPRRGENPRSGVHPRPWARTGPHRRPRGRPSPRWR